MFLSKEDVISVAQGALSSEEIDGGVALLRFNPDFREIFPDCAGNASAGAGIRLTFDTDATEIHMQFLVCTPSIRDILSPAMDLYVNDVLIGNYQYDLDAGEHGSFDYLLENGKTNRISLYLPFFVQISIQSLELSGASFFTPVQPAEKKWLLLGDSITQGFFCRYPSLSFACNLGRYCHADILNQGIGGYRFNKNMVQKIDFCPDLILVALGINDVFSDDVVTDTIPPFFDALVKEYPHTDIAAITPIKCLMEHNEEKLEQVKVTIRKQAERYSHLRIIDGDLLVPHMKEFYVDSLHPTALGMQCYALSLMNQLNNLYK